MTKLNSKEVRLIRKIGKKVPGRKLGRQLGVSNATISKVINKKSWDKVKDKPCPTCGE